jgi:hypothetical protein
MIGVVAAALGLTALTVVIHGAGTMRVAGRAVNRWRGRAPDPGRLFVERLLAELVAALLLLHLVEAIAWALFFRWTDALPDLESAAYFSLTSYTTVGYGDVVLPGRWRLLGPLEAAVGILMLGWSTGILVAVIGTVYREIFPAAKARR